MNNIILSKTNGINVHLCVCPRCGEENNSLALLGNKEYKYECDSCETNYLSSTHEGARCPNCKAYNRSSIGMIQENEKVAGDLCDKCKEEMETIDKEIKAGGIFFRCLNCKSEGVLSAEADISKEVRKEHPAPDPIGIEVEECPNCMEN